MKFLACVGVALGIFGFGMAVEPLPIESDYYKTLKINYEKERYRAVMIDDGIPAPNLQRDIVDFAIGLLGIQYKFGGQSVRGMDCSAFVQKVYAMLGIQLPRTARYQAQFGLFVNRENLKPGDLLFFRTYARFPSHVGIYIGEGKMIHASSAGGRIIISNIDKDYYLRHFLFAKRVFLYDPKIAYNSSKKEGETQSFGF
ncbi:MAG: C40 family peptidase [Aquificae bacterium]|nr:C40 family peptidase [Aquificota bacterium]